jgi:hypothetical protein
MSWERYTSQNTGLEIRLQSGAVAAPIIGYCHDASLGVVGFYITKSPVCLLSMTPMVQFVNTDIAWDISASMSATSTLDTYSIAFGGGGVTDITDAAWSGDKTGTVQYNAVGAYTVTATVTDVLGATSKPAKLTIQIVEIAERVYIGTTDSGVFILTPDGGPTASNSGLSGAQLNVRSLRVHPAYRDLPAGQQHVWIATRDGVSYSTDGAATWANISKATLGTPMNSAGDDPAPATADLDQIDIAFDPQDVNRVYVLRTTATRAWLFVSEDYGANWSNVQVYGCWRRGPRNRPISTPATRSKRLRPTGPTSFTGRRVAAAGYFSNTT